MATNQLTEVQPGPLQLNFIFGDGANHVGPCRVFLLDPKHDAQKVKIGEMMNCARSDHPGPGHKGEDITGHMTVAIPSTVPCDPAHCVLKWEWTATHISVTRPEYYDDCADLRITGAREAAAIAESPIGSQHRAREATDASLSAALKPPFSATEENVARHPKPYAAFDEKGGNPQDILALKGQIEALSLNRQVELSAYQRARCQ